MSSQRRVLVTGATGRQGSAVLRNLLAKGGFGVRALTRDVGSAAARALAAKGCELAKGDLEDPSALERACDGVWGVFSVQDPWAHGVIAEVRQGMNLADAARAAGVEHLVYSSVAASDQRTGVPHFESKGLIERYLARLGFRATVIRPVFFMDMLVSRFERRADQMWGCLRSSLGSTRTAQLISVEDIGRLAAESFADPDRYAGQTIELAADELDYARLSSAFAAALGKQPPRLPLPLPVVGLFNHEARLNFEWMRDVGWHVDLAATRRRFPWLKTLPEWLASIR